MVTDILRVTATVVGGLALVGAVASGAQERYPVFTDVHLTRTMKTLGPNVAAAQASLGAGDYEAAKAQLVRAREQLATTVTFWRDRHDDDAVALLRDALESLDGLDDALSALEVDALDVTTRAAALGGTCQACHLEYREQDPVTGAFRVKSR
jgi:hypothetical protein